MVSPNRYENPEERNSWSEYRRLITNGLADLDSDLKDLGKKVDENLKEADTKHSQRLEKYSTDFTNFQLKMTVEITKLNVKASLWGALGGSIVGAILVAVAELIILGKH